MSAKGGEACLALRRGGQGQAAGRLQPPGSRVLSTPIAPRKGAGYCPVGATTAQVRVTGGRLAAKRGRQPHTIL